MMLRYGMVGGGLGAFIGEVHRYGAMLNDQCILTAGCFSRNAEKNQRTAKAWNLPDSSRVYANYREMAEKESARGDGIDFVTIVTPNSSHYEIAKCFLEAGIHVMCDKPLALTLGQAEDLENLARKKHLLFGMTYAYTGYPVIRQARDMIRSGEIGTLLHVRVQHPEDWVISSVREDGTIPMGWRMDPSQAGDSLCTADLGSHAEMLLVSFTGLHIQRVLAHFDYYPKNLPLETNVSALLDLGDGISGDLWASQIAIGCKCSPAVYVIGTEGSLEWRHTTPDLLFFTRRNGPVQVLSAGESYMTPDSNAMTRVAAGHHIGYYEVFGNIYRAFCNGILTGKQDGFPTVHDGVESQRFIEACVRSHRNGNTWVSLRKNEEP